MRVLLAQVHVDCFGVAASTSAYRRITENGIRLAAAEQPAFASCDYFKRS